MFSNFIRWPVGKQWFTELGISLHDIFKKSHLLITHNVVLISKVLKYWEVVKLSVVDTSFPKLQFSLASYWQQYYHSLPLPCLPQPLLRIWSHFVCFWESTKYPSLNKPYFVYPLFFQIKMEKGASGPACNFVQCAEGLHAYSPFCSRILEWLVLKSWNVKKSNNFYLSTQDSLTRNWLSSLHSGEWQQFMIMW